MDGVEGKGSVKGDRGPRKVLPALTDGTNLIDFTPWALYLPEPLLSTLPQYPCHQHLLLASLHHPFNWSPSFCPCHPHLEQPISVRGQSYQDHLK